MFFTLSKILWFLAQPLNFLSLLFLAGLAFYKKPCGRRLVAGAALLFLLFGVAPAGPFLMGRLESEHPLPARLPERIDGIIVLGGAINGESSVRHSQPQLNESAERFYEMIKLSRTYPQARVIYSGGSGDLLGQQYKEADAVEAMLRDMGVETGRYTFERNSRTTYENAIESRRLMKPTPGENWLLVTSAFHMPRSVRVFGKQGWPVIPYPAGFIEDRGAGLRQIGDVSGNYWKLTVAAKEIIGIIAYKISGRI